MKKIGVIGPGIVGMPMAAMLADASLRGRVAGRPNVLVVQRQSPTSGWKVDAINAGRSPIGGVEPELDALVARTVEAGVLGATHHTSQLADADVVLVCTQTDRDGYGPDYGPLFGAVTSLAEALRNRPAGNLPVVVFESTLAPSSMYTLVRERFASHGLEEGRDVLLGNSPNRVMPGRLVERVRESDKLVGGIDPRTPAAIADLYGSIVERGTLHRTNSLTAEIVKTLENAYRDVRIAFAAEVVRFCDARDIDFHALRRKVNERIGRSDRASEDAGAVPSGALLVPTIGVGGHCLPKDGILLCWRWLEHTPDADSVFLEARRINDEAPAHAIALAERHFGSLAGRRVTLLGTAYRFDSEDTRNSPTLSLAEQLLERGCAVTLHDPFVRPDDQNLMARGLEGRFTRDVARAVDGADCLIVCVAHRVYAETWREIRAAAPRAVAVLDGCNLRPEGERSVGIGLGANAPDEELVDAVVRGFRTLERRVSVEMQRLIAFLNDRYAADGFGRADFGEVRRLAASCATGCDLVDVEDRPVAGHAVGFPSRLARMPDESRSAAPESGSSTERRGARPVIGTHGVTDQSTV